MAQRTLDITYCSDHFLRHNLEHGFFDMFALIMQVQGHYSLYYFWMRLKWLKITQFLFCLENFKWQLWKTKRENWHEPNNKSEIIGFYMEKIANLMGVLTSFWSPYFCSHLICGRWFAKLVFVSVVVEGDGSPAPTLWSSLLSPLLPPTSYTGEQFLTLVEQMVAGFTAILAENDPFLIKKITK